MPIELNLKHGTASYDEQDRERLSQYKWQSVKCSKPCHADALYVRARINGKNVYMHRMIMGAQPGEEVDHVDGNGLRNVRENLRFVTSSQNKMNCGLARSSTSRIKGVSWSPERRKWQVYIQIDKKRVPLGRFETVEEAVSVRLAAEAKHYGEHARPIDYGDAIDRLKNTALPRKEMIGRGRKRGFFGVRPKSHTDGHVGVRQHKSGRWIARLGTQHLGYFDTFESAVAARKSAEQKYFAEFAHAA